MNCSKTSILCLSLASNLLALHALSASPVHIGGTLCTDVNPHQIHDSIINYENYSSRPGSTYSVNFDGVGSLKLLNMVKSQAKFTMKNSEGTDAHVWIVLQPVHLDRSELYPRFLLNCKSRWINHSQFNHNCNLDTSREHFGLIAFTSNISLVHRACGGGRFGLDYNVSLQGQSEQVNQIKTHVLGSGIGSLLSPLFDEESFFRGYYENFYKSWIRSLQ